MFISRTKYQGLQQENEELRNKLDLVLGEMQQKGEFFEKFIESFNFELTKTIDQHELVNSQHHVMGDLVAKIKGRFDNVNNLSEYSFDNSKILSVKGCHFRLRKKMPGTGIFTKNTDILNSMRKK
jgi:methyl-accepting chemotaxis protein